MTQRKDPTQTDPTEDNEFEETFDLGLCTFLSAMIYLRKPNPAHWRLHTIKLYTPESLRPQLETQCKLEGLI